MTRLLRTLSDVTGSAKGDTGTVGVIGASPGHTGQPVLAALAALRTGTDVSRVLVSEDVHPIVANYSLDVLAGSYPSPSSDSESVSSTSGGSVGRFTDAAVEDALELAAWADALVIGPGLVDPDPAAIRDVIAEAEGPVIVDATAIEPALGGDVDLSSTIFTPDGAEEAWIEDEYGSIEQLSSETGAVVTLTGETDVIVDSGDRQTNETGTAALTVAGTGDTLTGIVASLLGQGLERAEAAELGAWILGKSGELASAEYGTGVVATDVIDRIPDTIR